MERETGVTGLHAVSPVGTATRRERGLVATPVQPQSPERAICPTARVILFQRSHSNKTSILLGKNTQSFCFVLIFLKVLKMPSGPQLLK